MNRTNITTIIAFMLMIVILIFVFGLSGNIKSVKKTSSVNSSFIEAERQMNRNRYERDLSRKSAEDIKAVMKYVDSF